jgi:hypothetical protein
LNCVRDFVGQRQYATSLRTDFGVPGYGSLLIIAAPIKRPYICAPLQPYARLPDARSNHLIHAELGEVLAGKRSGRTDVPAR